MPPIARQPWLEPGQLKMWRTQLSLTQAQAASLIGISHRHYSYLELGNTPISKMIALSCILIQDESQHVSNYQELSERIDRLINNT